MKKLFFLALLLNDHYLHAQPIPVDFKSCVVFIYLESPNNGEPIPDGTGFYMSVRKEGDSVVKVPVLVTAKHVIQNRDGSFVKTILIRVNTRDFTRYVFASIRLDGDNQNVYFHQDSSVDLAVIIGAPSKSDYDFKYLPDEFLTTRDEYKSITEGTEAFFVGLFTSYIGEKKNYPIFRFGHVALVTNERILFNGLKREMAIVETSTYGGNSGSPIFYRIFRDNFNWHYKLGGLVNGFFGNLQPLQVVNTGNNIPVTDLNIGIAAITPSYLIGEIINSPSFRQFVKIHK